MTDIATTDDLDTQDPITVNAMDTLITPAPPHAPVPYYFATKNGWMQNVPTLFGVAQVPATLVNPPNLPAIENSFILSDELVPAFIFDQALDFFRKVYTKHKTEATTYICRDKDGAYSLFIPTQYVTAASVNHKVDPGEMGERYPVGTIHSHCNFSAFHSGTDEHDMGKMPGVHATIGMVLNEEPQVAVALAVGQSRFNIDLSDIVNSELTKDANGYDTAPEHWLNFVHVNESAPWQKGITTSYRAPTVYGKGEWAGGWRGKWLDDDYGNWKPKVVSGEQSPQDLLILDDAETELTELTIALAEGGYRLQFTITHEPAMAASYLANLDHGKTSKLWED